jgi:ubiquinone/menaquinone biosynthesis C-methylase UbiE
MEIKRIIRLLRCVDCSNPSLDYDGHVIKCDKCGRNYEITNDKIVLMLPQKRTKLPEAYKSKEYVYYQKIIDKQKGEAYYSDWNWLFRWIHNTSHKIINQWSKTRKSSTILDLGCGTGDHFKYFNNDKTIIGLDICLPYLQAAREKSKNIFLIQGDVYNLPFNDESFGEILSIYNLEHIFHLGAALLEIDRILKKKGKLFCGIPTEGGFAWNFSRKISTERVYKKKFKVNYPAIIKIEHCNNYTDILKKLELIFDIIEKKWFPFLIPCGNLNLIITIKLKKKTALAK